MRLVRGCCSPGGVRPPLRRLDHQNSCLENSPSKGKNTMDRLLAAVVLAGAALTASAAGRAQQEQLAATTATAATATAAPAEKMNGATGAGADVNLLPAAPAVKSTIFGGEIRNIDSVRDVLTLKVYGESPMKILFDERTQVFLDGKQIP